MAGLIVDYAGDVGIISSLGMYALTVVLALALILGIDRPLDMLRTVVNVTGDTTVACVVDASKSD